MIEIDDVEVSSGRNDWQAFRRAECFNSAPLKHIAQIVEPPSQFSLTVKLKNFEAGDITKSDYQLAGSDCIKTLNTHYLETLQKGALGRVSGCGLQDASIFDLPGLSDIQFARPDKKGNAEMVLNFDNWRKQGKVRHKFSKDDAGAVEAIVREQNELVRQTGVLHLKEACAGILIARLALAGCMSEEAALSAMDFAIEDKAGKEPQQWLEQFSDLTKRGAALAQAQLGGAAI